MSDESNKPSGPGGDGPGADGARRRRRRRRKPAGGSGESAPGSTAESPPSGGAARSGPSRSGSGRSAPAKDDGKSGRKRRSRRRTAGDEPKAPGEPRPRREQKPRGEPGPRREQKPRGEQGPRREQPPRGEQTPRSRDQGASAAPRSSAPVDDGWALTPPPPAHDEGEDEAATSDAAVLAPGDAPWGDDSAAETPSIQLAADLPAEEATANDFDPITAPLERDTPGYDGPLSARIANVVAVRFVPAGRLYLYDAGDENFVPGDSVLVEGEHGKRIAIVGTASTRKPPKRSLKKILRRASDSDKHPQSADECHRHLQTAKELAKKQGLGIKVFRAQFDDPTSLSIYYSCEQKTDVRGLSRALSNAIPVRVDLRHTGARDEAKMVGGIGSCGQELCCTTWLPAFVPVSIKNAKEQGLVLNPTKVSGQCGRLKCCLVYEQSLYSEMRKGLPKLGKRVTTNDGHEGRVIEVDVLHQRIRVGIGRGESKVYGKGEVEPLFASQPQSQDPSKKPQTKSNKRKPAPEPSEGAPEPASPDANKEPSHEQD